MAERRSGFRWIVCSAQSLAGIALVGLAAPALAFAPDEPGAGDVSFSISSGQNVRAISPYIYGMNFFAGSSLTNPVTLDRLGGNRWSAYNWETNWSNAGKDYKYENDNHMTGGVPNLTPGAAVTPSLQSAAANDRALLVTVPMAGYVSGDANGPVQLADFAPSARFKRVAAKKSTIYADHTFSLNPNSSNISVNPYPDEINDNYVFTDEFVNWVESTKDPNQEVFYDLDNEPALWGETLPGNFNVDNWDNHLGNQPGRTHPEVHPYAPTFAEMRQKTIDHATAIKDVNPDALVFGGVGYGYAEFTGLQGATDFTSSPSHPGGDHAGELNYNEYLLQQVRNAEVAQGRKLMDVLDLHWYPEARGLDDEGVSRRITFDPNQNDAGVAAARVQAPRSLWDPTYTETSWITQCCSGGPIKLLPNVQRDIDDFDPGTKIAVSEYNFGGTNHISGAIAEADVLGIFGQQNVFAATLWPSDSDANSQFVSGAFKMYLDYDGAGGKFGDTAVDAATSSLDASAVYASLDSNDPNRMVLVAINRTDQEQDAAITVEHDRIFDHAEVYQLTAASPNPVRGADIELDLVNALVYSMPAYSVTTLVLVSDGLPGDYNRDGVVDAGDYTVWRDSLGQSGNLPADGNEDNTIDAKDYALWKENFGRSEAIGSGGSLAAVVPEPAAIALLMFAACGFACCYRELRPRHTR
jgi:Glycoside hydrolase family 44/Dockerin type I domain